MKTQRVPVIYVIEGTSFLVDVQEHLLRQTKDTKNTISFDLDMRDYGTHYAFLYDVNECLPKKEFIDFHDVRLVQVPQMTELDPQGMAEKYGKTVAEVQGKSDFEVIVNREAYERRCQGHLPQIEIAGDRFIVDLDEYELRLAERPFTTSSLGAFATLDDTHCLEAFYNLAEKRVVHVYRGLTELPDHVVQIVIPDEMQLDPVGYARHYGKDEKQLLRVMAAQPPAAVTVVPLSETYVPALIARNREKPQEHLQIAQTQTKRKGLRL